MTYLKFLCVLVTSVLVAQSDTNPTAGLKNLAPPNSPAFVLMDIAPSNIIVPDNIQAFSIQTINAFSGNSKDGLGNNNYAVEFQPYWYVKREKMNFFKYNNLKTDKPEGETISVNDYTRYNVFGDVWKKASVSLALMDGTFNVFEVPQSFVSVGVRTRLLTVKTKNQIAEIKSQYTGYEEFMSSPEVIAVFANPSLSLSEINTAINSLEGYQTIVQNFEQSIQRKPFFALDVAVAYSHFMGDKSQDMDDAFGRLGFWATGDLAFYTPTIGKQSHVHIYGVFRYLRDGLNLDPDSGELRIENTTDYGAKIALELDKLSFGYEYITRDSENNNEERSIGSIRYKISEAFTINGGFGKNFVSEGTTVVLFGIQWGLDFDSSVVLDPNR
ncbi:hypothetical protein [Gelidibacter maritimus]|uniref:DUF5723 domain-containing protein n=1 Tax=Gelidibacter maritimus TaxID=2761487 RepID=A0A7W2M4A1_9FLAO|nr:hypothetical protein [Gelidibacter maritimus]MBA6152465.1 hypothetical protein [Gelidibacter maritimus]